MNMKYTLGIFAAFVLLVFASGCITPQVNISAMTTPETNEAPADLITVTDINTIPNQPIDADTGFSLTFNVNNVDDIKEVNNVGVYLYDYGLCGKESAKDMSDLTFAPLQSEFIEWKFTAPSNDQISYMPSDCKIRWKANYSFSAMTQVDFQVISKQRLQEKQRAGEEVSFSPTQTIGRGPIKINFGFSTGLPVQSGKDMIFFIWVENKGSGIIGDLNPRRTNFYLKIPKDVTDFDNCSGRFAPVKDGNGNILAEGNYKIYNLTKTIPMIEKKSPKIRCSFKVPNINDERTFFIYANITNYSYDIDNQYSVKINPTG